MLLHRMIASCLQPSLRFDIINIAIITIITIITIIVFIILIVIIVAIIIVIIVKIVSFTCYFLSMNRIHILCLGSASG